MDCTDRNLKLAFLGEYPGNLPICPAAPKQLVDQSAVGSQAGARGLCRQVLEDIPESVVHNPPWFRPNGSRTDCRTSTEQRPNKRRTKEPSARVCASLSRRLRDGVLLMTSSLTLKLYSTLRTETPVISGPLSWRNLSALAGSRSRLTLWADRSPSNEAR